MELLDRQNIKKLSKRKVQKHLKSIFFYLSISKKYASFVFCDNLFITELNRQYFKKDVPTDVISFPMADQTEPAYLGEVVVSVEEAVSTAKELNLNWQRELLLYLIHGILHLIGFKDTKASQRQKMEKKQKEVLDQFKEVALI